MTPIILPFGVRSKRNVGRLAALVFLLGGIRNVVLAQGQPLDPLIISTPLSPLAPQQLPSIPDTALAAAAGAEMKAAMAHFRAKEIPEALAKAEAFVATAPTSALGHHLIGMCRLFLGQFEGGIAALQAAASFAPDSIEPLVAIANAFAVRGDLSQARKYFELILEKKPGEPGAHQGLALISEKEGKLDAAAAHFQAANKGTPADAVGTKLPLAAYHNRQRQFDKTIALLSGPALQAKPLNASAIEMLAIAYLGSGRIDDAIKTYNLVYASAPSAQLALGLGIAYLRSNRLSEALKYFKEATDSRANWSPAWTHLAEAQIGLADYSAALSSLEKGKAFAADTAPIDLRIGDVYVLAKDYPKAIAHFGRLAEAKEPTLEVIDRLGATYQASGDMAGAERTFKAAANKFLKSPLPSFKLGLLYGQMGRHADAVAALESAATLESGSSVARRALIAALAKAGNPRRAIEVAESVAKDDPKATEPKLFLASLHGQFSDHRRAAEIYRDILKTEPDHVVALNNLAMALGSAGEFDEAIRLSARAVSLLPKSGQLLDTLGWLNYQKGNFPEAVSLLRKSAELAPKDPSILFHLGMAHSKQNDKAAALKALKDAVALSKVFPEYQQATQMIASLGGGP